MDKDINDFQMDYIRNVEYIISMMDGYLPELKENAEGTEIEKIKKLAENIVRDINKIKKVVRLAYE